MRDMTPIVVLSVFLSACTGLITMRIVPSSYMETNAAVWVIITVVSYFIFLGVGCMIVKSFERGISTREIDRRDNMFGVAGSFSIFIGFVTGVIAIIILEPEPYMFLGVLLGIGGAGFCVSYGISLLIIAILIRGNKNAEH